MSITFGSILGMSGLYIPVSHTMHPVLPVMALKVVRPIAKPALYLPHKPIRKGLVTVNDSNLELHQMITTYSGQFEGMVSCGTEPCHEGKVVVQLDSKNQPDIEKEAEIQPDGKFSVTVSLRELPDEQLDWKIIVHSPLFSAQERDGRRILSSEDTSFSINQTISL